MKDKLDKAIKYLKECRCPLCDDRVGIGACSWCDKRHRLFAEVESSEDKCFCNCLEPKPVLTQNYHCDKCKNPMY